MKPFVNNLNAVSRSAICLVFCLALGGLMLNLPSPTAAQGLGADSSAYVLHANDQLSIEVMGHDDYTKQVTILPDGTFDYPTVGTIHAAGLTVPELRSYMTKGLSDELNEPDVTISVTQSLTQVVSVLGSVTKAGSYPYQFGWHVVDALAVAGGLSSTPDMTAITVVRSGDLLPISIDTVKLLSGQDVAQNVSLEPGDTVLVQQKSQADADIQVTGEVKVPGSYPSPEDGMAPLAVIIAAGGVTKNAALSQSQWLHDGQVHTVDLRYVITDLSNAPNNVVLMPGDSLLIPTIVGRVSVLGNVNDPETYNIPDGQTITVSQAIGLANGSDYNANLSRVAVLRQKNGAPTLISVNLQKVYAGLPGGNDVLVQPGDVIFVPAKQPKQYRPQDLVLLVPFLNLLR